MNVESKFVKIRIFHKCFGCLGMLRPGADVLKNTDIIDGKFCHTYWCEVCNTYWQERHLSCDDLIEEGELKNCDPEGWEEIRAELESVSQGELEN